MHCSDSDPRDKSAVVLMSSASPYATRLIPAQSGAKRPALRKMFRAENTVPDFLLLDEPTNNLERAGRKVVLDLMHSWSGGAIVVSHDRELLEDMDAIVELTPRFSNSSPARSLRKPAM